MSFVIDPSDALDHLKRAQEGVIEATKLSVAIAGRVAWENAVSTTLYKDQSGKLREKTALEQGRTEYSVALVARTRYAEFVNGGSAEVNGKLMRMVINGQVIFRTKRKAIAARPFMDIAEKAGEQSLQATLDREVNDAVKR